MMQFEIVQFLYTEEILSSLFPKIKRINYKRIKLYVRRMSRTAELAFSQTAELAFSLASFRRLAESHYAFFFSRFSLINVRSSSFFIQ